MQMDRSNNLSEISFNGCLVTANASSRLVIITVNSISFYETVFRQYFWNFKKILVAHQKNVL